MIHPDHAPNLHTLVFGKKLYIMVPRNEISLLQLNVRSKHLSFLISLV